MSRRICGPLSFFFVAGLVFAGLGWVTVAALRVEQEQRDSAAEVELGHNLRIALWRLDGRMLSPLSVEDSRPFQHYAGGELPTVYGPGSAPLLDAPLPDWMLLHFQVDSEAGWTSPQVMSPTLAMQCRQNWPGLNLRNVNHDKAALLDNLKAKFPAQQVTEGFAFRERSSPENVLESGLHLENYNPAPELLQAYPNLDSRTSAALTDPMTASSPDGVTIVVDGSTTSTPVNDYRVPLERFEQGAQQGVATREQNSGSTVAPTNPQALSASRNTTRGANELTNEYQKRLDIGRAATSDAKSASVYPLMQNSLATNGQFNYGSQNGVAVTQLPTLVPTLPNPTGTSDGGGMGANAGASGPVVPATSNSARPTLGSGTVDSREKESVISEPATTTPRSKDAGSERLFETWNWFGRRDPPSAKRDAEGAFKQQSEAKKLAEEPEDLLRQKQATDGSSLNFFSMQFQGEPQSQPGRGNRGLESSGLANELPATRLLPVVSAPTPDHFINGNLQPLTVHLGSMRPQWITAADGTEVLVFVRTARIDDRTVYQGVVVDWVRLEASLREDVSDLFPEARLLPVKDAATVSPERAMTALPLQLDPGSAPAPVPLGWTPLRLGLVLAWVAAIIAFAAVGYSRWSILDLAERRIRFVSAVTHELRTPLTSLRLYLDLLLSGMVKEEEKRNEYLATLNTESDRLHRLIDNVLDYARLEKRRKASSQESIRVTALLEQIKQTWAERCGADAKELVVISTLPPDEKVSTDPHLVQQIVGNLIDNARKYTRDAADKRIWLWAKPGGRNRIVFEVEDRGEGVPVNERRTVFQPFRRGDAADTKAGGAGLGLALAKQWAELLGGHLTYRPADGGTGACFKLELRTA